MLTVTEDLVLLALQKHRGRFPPREADLLRHALTGAALMDLELGGRIDTDLERLEVIDRTPTGQPFLDPALERIAASSERRDVWGWLIALAAEEELSIRDEAVAGLVGRGLLQRRKALLPFGGPRYRVRAGGAEEREVKERLAETLFGGEEIPDPQAIALICIADACDLLGFLFGKKRMRQAAPRIQQLRKMDLVGSGTVAQFALWQLEHMLD